MERTEMKVLLSIAIVLQFEILQAQNKFHPTGLVLCPLENKVEGSWENLIANYVVKGEISPEEKAKFVNNKIPINWRTIRENELAIIQDQNFFSFLSLTLSREINYQLQESSPNLLIYPVRDSVKSVVTEYQKFLTTRKMDWLVNPYKVLLTETNGKKSMEVWLQLHYQPTNHLQINTSIKVTEDEVVNASGESVISNLLAETVKRLATTAVDRISRMR
jgi:hypothetical protein